MFRASKDVMCSVYGCGSCAQANTRLCKHHMAVRGLSKDEPSVKKKRKPKLPKGKFGSGHGYVMVWTSPRFPGAYPYGNGWAMMEHRKVMGEIIGRAVLPGETVHHINGIKHDNRPSNLELWVSSHPSGQRVSDQLEWAKQIIERYEGLPEIIHNSHTTK